MDKRELTLIDDALRAARGLGLGAEAVARERRRQAVREDARVEIRHGGRRIAYNVEAKRALAPA